MSPTGPRCAFCHDGAGARARPCPGCATLLHPECWAALQERCPTLGCRPPPPCRAGDRPMSWPGRVLLGLLASLAKWT